MMSRFILSFLFKFDDVENQHKTKEYPAKPQIENLLKVTTMSFNLKHNYGRLVSGPNMFALVLRI